MRNHGPLSRCRAGPGGLGQPLTEIADQGGDPGRTRVARGRHEVERDRRRRPAGQDPLQAPGFEVVPDHEVRLQGEAELSDLDEVKIGDTEFRFELDLPGGG